MMGLPRMTAPQTTAKPYKRKRGQVRKENMDQKDILLPKINDELSRENKFMA